MWVKICANTNAEDALRAAEMQADAVGFVFAPSKRQVTPEKAREISQRLPPHVERVGVFMTSAPDEIAAAVEAAGLTAVQMHGGLQPEAATRLRERLDRSVELIHVVHWRVGGDDESQRHLRAQLAELTPSGLNERVLLDAKVGEASGGLGVAFEWQAARSVLEQFPKLRVIIAGGLRPENVAEAVRVLRPYGVDVASGVETEPGRKDYEKLRMFMQNTKPVPQR